MAHLTQHPTVVQETSRFKKTKVLLKSKDEASRALVFWYNLVKNMQCGCTRVADGLLCRDKINVKVRRSKQIKRLSVFSLALLSNRC